MRDFIHTHWARWLKLEVKSPEDGASRRQWDAYRAAVGPMIGKSRN